MYLLYEKILDMDRIKGIRKQDVGVFKSSEAESSVNPVDSSLKCFREKLLAL
jgi:hypothetical protein